MRRRKLTCNSNIHINFKFHRCKVRSPQGHSFPVSMFLKLCFLAQMEVIVLKLCMVMLLS